MQSKHIFWMIGIFSCITIFCAGCSPFRANAQQTEVVNDDIVILYTNDVHCHVEGEVGYAGVAAYKKSCLEKTPYVTLVDIGDAVEGELLNKITQKETLVDDMDLLMNRVGYDYAVLGNHEFDLGIDNVKRLIDGSDAQYLVSNIQYTGTGENKLSAVEPYEIVEYGSRKVAFIGVCTPRTVTKKERPTLMENGELVYDFNADVDKLYQCVQQNVDECRQQGANYVVVLSHLGDKFKVRPHTSINLIKNTTGIDVVLDGHSHSTIASKYVKNQDGDKVLLSSTGHALENLGQLVIGADGSVRAELISSVEHKDENVKKLIEELREE